MNNTQRLISNKKERIRVFYTLIIFSLIVVSIAVVALQSHFQLNFTSYRTLRRLRGATGQFAAIAFTFSIAMYVVRRVVKRVSSKEIKKKLLVIARITREWHVPISIMGFAIVLVHAYIMLSRFMVFNLRYVSGMTALGILGVQMLSGAFRYKKLGVKFHMITGIAVIAAMVIHLLA